MLTRDDVCKYLNTINHNITVMDCKFAISIKIAIIFSVIWSVVLWLVVGWWYIIPGLIVMWIINFLTGTYLSYCNGFMVDLILPEEDSFTDVDIEVLDFRYIDEDLVCYHVFIPSKLVKKGL